MQLAGVLELPEEPVSVECQKTSKSSTNKDGVARDPATNSKRQRDEQLYEPRREANLGAWRHRREKCDDALFFLR